MKPKEYIDRLKKISSIGGVEFSAFERLAEAEYEYSVASSQMKGHVSLSKAAACFFLNSVPRFNLEIQPRLVEPVPPDQALLIEKIAHIFSCLRASEIASNNGYPLQGFTILRNAYDDCVLASAAAQGFTTFSRLHGVEEGEEYNEGVAKKRRKKEEGNIRRLMDGTASGLTAQTTVQLRKLDSLYDLEVHSGRVSQIHSVGWLRGTDGLRVTPSYNEMNAATFMCRFSEVGWMFHRLLPNIQPSGIQFSPDWGVGWQVIDESFEIMVASMTEQLGKPIGSAMREFVNAKFPFDQNWSFPSQQASINM